MRKAGILLAVSAAALVAPVVQTPATADHCQESPVVIFSSPLGVNSNAAVCIVAPGETEAAGLDTRVVNPASTAVSVRYIQACTPGDRVKITVFGLGADRTVDGRCADTGLGATVYDTSLVPIDRTATGYITATVDPLVCEDDGDPATTDCHNTFHTVDRIAE